MSSLSSPLWPPPPPLNPPAAGVPDTSSHSISPSLVIISFILIFVIIACISIHLLLKFLSRLSSPSSRVSSIIDLHLPPESETTEENNDHNKAEALIEALPLFTLASSLSTLPKSSPDCAVCLSPFDPTAELRLLPACRHAFHSNCIDTWLRSTPSCPLCRASVQFPFPPLPSSGGDHRPESFRVEIGSISRRRTSENPNSASGRSYSIGSFDYLIEDDIEAVISRIERLKEEKYGEIAGAPASPGENLAEIAGGEGRGWLRDYVDRFASSASSSFSSLRFSNRWSARWSHRQEHGGAPAVEAASLEVEGEEEAFYAVYRWIAGV